MSAKVKDLTVDELKKLVSKVVHESMDELAEDIAALASKKYLKSIEEARKDYRKGRIKSIDEIADV